MAVAVDAVVGQEVLVDPRPLPTKPIGHGAVDGAGMVDIVGAGDDHHRQILKALGLGDFELAAIDVLALEQQPGRHGMQARAIDIESLHRKPGAGAEIFFPDEPIAGHVGPIEP